ncbi:nuclear export mediator factor NEMF-like [Homarus americanus]|uniref:nuclear export mediator factor NEMF-like n=1 Tax=Homarus americanus TaxID=6706 RepID=UPI001C47E403|nr:nuclear export mediator factor NEMF-like [Homarus americanus]
MKTTFTTVDLLAIVAELRARVIGMRVIQIYDVDAKTYLLKLQKPEQEQKCLLLIESGTRIHTTDYEWPKSPAPSGFSMKLRKHLRNKRIEDVHQLGVDRIIDLKFGSGEMEHHIILELYDHGNIVLTDHSYTILNILRPRKEGEDVRFAVHETYPVDRPRLPKPPLSLEDLKNALSSAKENTPLKKILNPLLDCGGGVVDHVLLEAGFPVGTKCGHHLKIDDDLTKLHTAAAKAQAVVTEWSTRSCTEGYIIKKVEQRKKADGSTEDVPIFQEFMPFLFAQHAQSPSDKFPTFNQACDEFYSKMEAGKIDHAAVQKEKEALKKLENVKRDHERRLQELSNTQKTNESQGHMIELNKDLVDATILVVRSAVANQIDWRQIKELLAEAQGRGDPVAQAIKQLKLESNTITLSLSNPYDCDEDDLFLDSDEEREEGNDSTNMRPITVDIDLELSAMANARKYFDQKRQAAKKEQKTIDASAKVLQLTTRKTNLALKEVAASSSINKARKVIWFEKFHWFISSENFLVIAGRDSQMNEMIVKRHLRPRDVYVHADMHGAPSVIIKNPSSKEPPPKTLHEAGIMALCYSRAWEEKVITSAWWVWGEQVSKTAPTGEYLTTGAFMIRGKKNFLPPSHLIYGFGFLFRLEDESISRHAGERKIRSVEEDVSSISLTETTDDHSDLPLVEEENDKQLEKEEQETEDASLVDKNQEVKSELVKEDSADEECSEEETDKDGTVEFPDTVVDIKHIGGDQFSIRARTVSTTSQLSAQSGETREDEDSTVVYLGDDQPVTINRRRNDSINKYNKGKKGDKKTNPKAGSQQMDQQSTQEQKCQQGTEHKDGPPKRGQKNKMKKMKKYRDQDEEEREIRMQLLQSAGNNKDQKKGKGGKKAGKEMKGKGPVQKVGPKSTGLSSHPNRGNLTHITLPEDTDTQVKKEERQEEEEDEDEATQLADDLNIINTLTAMPVAEDELLFTVPVCAPYTAMTNFKYKVKLTPGPGKKGKACKTAVTLFMGDKSATPREKDLLRAVRDQDLARNLPGKVKVSAPNITKIKK